MTREERAKKIETVTLWKLDVVAGPFLSKHDANPMAPVPRFFYSGGRYLEEKATEKFNKYSFPSENDVLDIFLELDIRGGDQWTNLVQKKLGYKVDTMVELHRVSPSRPFFMVAFVPSIPDDDNGTMEEPASPHYQSVIPAGKIREYAEEIGDFKIKTRTGVKRVGVPEERIRSQVAWEVGLAMRKHFGLVAGLWVIIPACAGGAEHPHDGLEPYPWDQVWDGVTDLGGDDNDNGNGNKAD